MLSNGDWAAIWLTAKLSFISTGILFLIGTPLAWWLARTKSKFKSFLATIIGMPLVLPPTVIGFYLLMAMGPNGPIGKLTELMGIGTLPFTFAGLIIASVVYSLPFMVQPLQAGFESSNHQLLDVAATLGASPFDRFITIALPVAWPSFIVAGIMTFTHTIGEFGVVLMIGGNIPEVSRVVSVQIYDHVESFNYAQAHRLSLFLLLFSFTVLFIMQKIRNRGII